jgi:flagellar basal-body rod protein FlgF
MVDRLIYIASTGAKHILEQQATTAHNVANATTTGFRAQLDSFRAVPVVGGDLPTRAYVVDSTVGSDFTQGALQTTGRDLDVALDGKGWLVVQKADGSEAFTRNGSLKVSENGVLQTVNGLDIVGDAGPITIPPDVTITIAKDGTVSTVPAGTNPNPSQIIGRLKLVNPAEATIIRGDDGLFKTKDGTQVDADAAVRIVDGTLESSNVSPVEGLVSMINLARQFELQTKLITEAESNETKASQILTLTS